MADHLYQILEGEVVFAFQPFEDEEQVSVSDLCVHLDVQQPHEVFDTDIATAGKVE